MTPTVRKALVANAIDNNWNTSETDFYQYSASTISSMCQLYYRPTDKLDFYKKMDLNVEFKQLFRDYTLSVVSFMPMFQSL